MARTVYVAVLIVAGAVAGSPAVAIGQLEVDGIGLNCATGPVEMAEHVRVLSQTCRKFISVQPNAGLPVMVDGETVFPLGPDELAEAVAGSDRLKG